MAGKKRPKVGLGVLVLKDGKVLLAKRKRVFGRGEYAFPGGHLEFGESIEDCAKRECREEAGIEITNVRFLRFSNLKFFSKHYADIGIVADWEKGEPQVLEPHRTESWAWYDLDNLPSPLFEPCKHSFIALKNSQNFFDG